MPMMEFHDCPNCGTKGVLPMSDGKCPNCKRGLSEEEKVTEQSTAGTEELHEEKRLDIGRVGLGIAAVVLLHIAGSELVFSTPLGGGFIYPYLPLFVGFVLAACWAKERFFLHMVIVFGVSYILAGFCHDIYYELLGLKFDWDYYWETIPLWVIAFIAGSLIGRLSFIWWKN